MERMYHVDRRAERGKEQDGEGEVDGKVFLYRHLRRRANSLHGCREGGSGRGTWTTSEQERGRMRYRDGASGRDRTGEEGRGRGSFVPASFFVLLR
jgi:hypothetical protein